MTCILSAVACGFALCFVLRVDRLHLHVPMVYSGDAVYFQAWVKGIMEGNLPWHNIRLGMPLGADWRDFPITLTIEVVVIRMLGIFTSSSGLVQNLVWLLGTAACAGFAAYSLQRLGIEKWVAGALGIIYALQPFTFFRGVTHFNLMFYLVPLMAAGAIEIAAGNIPGKPMHSSEAARTRWAAGVSTLRKIPVYLYLACVAQGISYIYNTFFSIILLGIAGLLAYTVSRKRSALFAASAAVILTCGVTVITLTPSLVYWAGHGKNPAMAYKSPEQAEFYALKLRYLLTPIPKNPLPPLQYIQRRLDGAGFSSDSGNEAITSRLGTIGSAGLLFLLASALVFCVGRPFRSNDALGVMGACAALTLTCFLLATVGGFGSLFSVFITPDIRAYNRIIVFVDFFAIVAVGLLLTQASVWCLQRHWPKPLLVLVLAALVVFGVSDQAFTMPYRDHVPRETEFKLDDAYVRSIESLLPRNAEIFQLPFTDFPMNSAAYHEDIYDQGKPYLHSHTLRWSWGAMSGRKPGEWARETSNLPVKEMLKRLSAAGFTGVWIDRSGYAPGTSLEQQIGAAIGVQPLQRSDGRMAFYDLRPFTKRLQASQNPEQMPLGEQQTIHSVEIAYPVGFFAEERNDIQTWRWCSQHGVMHMQNTLPQLRTVKLIATLRTGDAQPDTIKISAEGRTETVKVTDRATTYVREIQLPGGGSVDVSFDCKCNRVIAPRDPRNLYFALINPKIME